jgi:hypothetical protein
MSKQYKGGKIKTVRYWALLNLVIIFTGCREYYDAGFITPETGYLVVEGFINYGSQPTVISLSRTKKISGPNSVRPEEGATVFVESDQNDRYLLQETTPGAYTSGTINLEAAKKYRLFIKAKGKEYVSEFTPVQQTPDIDSITWKRENENEGIQLYVHSHDPNNTSRYYQWKYEETWEINPPFASTLEYDFDNHDKITGVKYRYPNKRPETAFQKCWPESKSKGLLLWSTEKLDKDLVYLPFLFIPPNSVRISVLYSILLKQYKLSESAYNFLLQMKKNSEQLGSIFDPQPSEMPGNITCITAPGEVVVGFVEVTQEKTKRLFISRQEVGRWNYFTDCEITVIDNHPDSIIKYGLQVMPSLVSTDDDYGNITKFSAAPPLCIDCRVSGGTNIKPSFWP